MSKLADTLLPNRAWLRHVRGADSGTRPQYWGLRLGLAVLLLVLMYVFKIQQHPALK